jgi:CHAT domain-containing protein/Tfp pilus assembly protein PilF
MLTRFSFNKRAAIATSILLLRLAAVTVSGQTQQPNDTRELPPNQTLEREIKGTESHRYVFDLQAGEFFQVRVEQKGVDVALKLLDTSGNIVAMIDSPTGPSGPETLSFIAAQAQRFVLEIGSVDAKAPRGIYVLKREASRAQTTNDKRRVEAERVFSEGMKARDTAGEGETAVRKFSEALTIWRALADDYMGDLTARLLLQSKARVKLIAARDSLKKGMPDDLRNALAGFQEAYHLYLEGGDKDKAAISLLGAGVTVFKLGEKQSSLEFYNLALQLFREAGDKSTAAAVAHGIGQIYIDLGYPENAIESYRAALDIQREIGDRAEEAKLLLALGIAHVGLGEKQKALDYFNQALLLQRSIANRAEEAITLSNMGRVYEALGEKLRAIELYEQSLAIFRALNDGRGDATSLTNLGAVYSSLGEKQKALTYYEASLALRRRFNDKAGEAATLSNIGLVHSEIGNKQAALEFHYRALYIFREIGDKYGEASALNNLGLVNFDLGEKRIAIDFFKRALARQSMSGNKTGEAVTLSNIGKVYDSLGDSRNAKAYFQEALALNAIIRSSTPTVIEPKNEFKPAKTELREVSRVDEEARRSLIIYLRQVETSRKLGVKATEASALTELMFITWALDSPAIAICYGKQAVNVFQELRAEMKGGDLKLQGALSRSFEDAYRKLSDILIAEGRIVEAEQVLAMLKQEEVFDYLRRDASEIDKLQQRADLKPKELEALKHYNEIADKIASLSTEFGTLQDLQSKGVKLSDKQAKRYAELSTQVEDANRSFQVFLRQVADEFAARTNTEKDLQENLALKSDLKSWGGGVDFLYTLVGADRYRVILVTPETQVDGKTDIKAAELNDKIEKFRAAVQNPAVDPRPQGKELYDILIKPIEKQLDGAKAKTLLWSLDGNLRLLPLAALWDGTQYFGQKYQNVIVTLASRTRLSDTVESNWRALGLGVTEAKKIKGPNGTQDIDFKSLPAVRAELLSIVQSEQSPNGVLPGQSLLDADFSENAFESQLLRGYKLVHIASHFSLNPGDSTRSFLLLGDGNVLTVDEMKNNPRLNLRGVELLTLSACQTAVVEKDSSGKEVEGLGYVAQQKGAKAVLASLWRVADESTQLLMSEFYRLRKENPQLTKAAALQMAQQEMIAGKLKPTQSKSVRRDTGEADAQPSPDYAHPYYWSPFILIGNWK